MSLESISTTTQNNMPPPSLGKWLQSVREEQGLDHKDVASQLRLNEQLFIMIEEDRYPADLPLTYLRGYIRAYGKLLQIPESELQKSLDSASLQQNRSNVLLSPPVSSIHPEKSTETSFNHPLIRIFTVFISLALIGLATYWWYSSQVGRVSPVATNAIDQSSKPNQTALEQETASNQVSALPTTNVPAHTNELARDQPTQELPQTQPQENVKTVSKNIDLTPLDPYNAEVPSTLD